MTKKVFVFLLTMGILSGSAYSQNSKKIDSMKVLIQKYEEKNHSKSLSIADSAKVNLYIKLCIIYDYDLPNEALGYAKKALLISEKIGYPKGLADSYFHLGRFLSNTGKFDEAVSYLKKAIPIYKELKDELKIADSYNNIGIFYGQKENFPEALQAFFNSLKIYEKRKETKLLAAAYSNIGIVFKMQDKYDESLKYYLKALTFINEKNKKDIQFVGIYANIGQLYQRQQKYDESTKMLLMAYNISNTHNNEYANSIIFQSLGNNYKEQKQYDKALEYLNKAKEIFVKMENQDGVAVTNINIGYCLFRKGEVQKGLTIITNALEVSKKEGYLQWQVMAYEYLSEIYKGNKDYKKAFDNEVLFKMMNDSVFNTEKERKFIQMQMQHEFDKIQDETKQTQRQKILQMNQETGKQRSIKYIVMAVLLCLSVLMFGIFFNLRKNQKQKAIIAQQKETVEDQNKIIRASLTEKETLLREIHHRVKNNLQIISSLLNIQSQHIQDENVLLSIQEGQSRVQAMSLIHQNLYQSEHLSNVDIENYLKELVVYLSQTFAGSDKSIAVEVNAKNIQFDIDTAIPLGLIVNELVSNAYKYAFEKKDSGKIKIRIKAINQVDYELNVSDDGAGLPQDFDPKKNNSLGLKLVNILSRQLRGNMIFSSDTGASFTVKFKDIKAYQASIS